MRRFRQIRYHIVFRARQPGFPGLRRLGRWVCGLDLCLARQRDDRQLHQKSEGTTGKGENYLSAEIDTREEGPNEGKTSFSPGDTVWFLVYKGESVDLVSAEASAGSASLGEEIEVAKSEDVVFDGSASTVSLDKINGHRTHHPPDP
jgi:hypothetical protein